jgi:uncharacterized protein (TIGR00369 family)
MNASLPVLEKEVRELTLRNVIGAKFPPDCFIAMKGEFVDYDSRRALAVSFPVLEESLNPLREMQGGFLVAAFDNVFGPLSYLAARRPCVTLTLNTQFIRPVSPGDRLTVRCKVVSRSLEVLQMAGEAFDSKSKLVATATATTAVVREER